MKVLDEDVYNRKALFDAWMEVLGCSCVDG